MANEQDDLTPEGTFEISLRVLGNEFIGLKIVVDDIKTKWITVSLIAIGVLGYTVYKIGPTIATMLNQ